ncbi:MAG: erythromycin biosynthesis sensory transduction protein eryC1 [Acidobacteria bacterium]|nr:MAG: erythromycin biosynthesis sensory transduction protein eryC1 [Acidobacteriota bacterium]
MNVPFVDLRAQYRSIRNEVLANIQQVLEKCNFVLGEEVRQFEEEFAAYCGVRFAIGVANGTDAIHLAVRAAGIGPGDECLIPANTFIATALGVSYAGARPVPVDADARTFLMDLGKLENALTPKTKAVIPVHLYGRIMDMEPLLELARKHNLVVIEDAAQAHGAAIRDRKAGSFGTLSCFSFYPGKNLGAYGDAGLVATNDPDLKARVEALRNYGSPQKYHHPIIGFNSRLDTLQAAVLRAKLPHIDAYNAARYESAVKYDRMLEGIGDLVLPQIPARRSHIFHLYVIRTKRRDALQQYLGREEVGTLIHYPKPIHLHGAYEHLGYKEGAFPAAEQLSKEVLSLPMFPEITDEQLGFVAEKIREFFKGR